MKETKLEFNVNGKTFSVSNKQELSKAFDDIKEGLTKENTNDFMNNICENYYCYRIIDYDISESFAIMGILNSFTKPLSVIILSKQYTLVSKDKLQNKLFDTDTVENLFKYLWDTVESRGSSNTIKRLEKIDIYNIIEKKTILNEVNLKYLEKVFKEEKDILFEKSIIDNIEHENIYLTKFNEYYTKTFSSKTTSKIMKSIDKYINNFINLGRAINNIQNPIEIIEKYNMYVKSAKKLSKLLTNIICYKNDGNIDIDIIKYYKDNFKSILCDLNLYDNDEKGNFNKNNLKNNLEYCLSYILFIDNYIRESTINNYKYDKQILETVKTVFISTMKTDLLFSIGKINDVFDMIMNDNK